MLLSFTDNRNLNFQIMELGQREKHAYSSSIWEAGVGGLGAQI